MAMKIERFQIISNYQEEGKLGEIAVSCGSDGSMLG